MTTPPNETTPDADSGTPASGAAPSRTGRRIAIALVIVWVAIIVGLYAVLAKLKMGGAEALRSDAPGHGAAHAPAR